MENRELLRATAGSDAQSLENRKALAQVLANVWKQGVLEPTLIGDIFSRIDVEAGIDAKFPLDFYTPADSDGTEFDAFVIAREGAVPNRVIDGDEVHVPTYKIANSISWNLDYARDARWDVIARAIEVFTNGFTRKMNDDGLHTLLAAGGTTETVDTAASAGSFTKKLVTDLQVAMKRQAGGRDARLTNLLVSPEAIADIRLFAETQVDDGTLRSLINSDGNPAPSLFGVELNELIDLGASQALTTYWTGTIGGTLDNSDEEIVIGLDLSTRDSFVMPVREDMQMFDDATLHRSGKAGVYGWMELGFACLDTRRVITGAF